MPSGHDFVLRERIKIPRHRVMAEPFGRLRAGWVETALCSKAVRIMFIMLLAAESGGFGTLEC